MTGKHAPDCRWPKGFPCLRFSTDGTLAGAEIAHTMGTTSEEEIIRRGFEREPLTGMDEEQADWEETGEE